MPAPHHSFFTGQMPFLPPNQQRQSTEGTMLKYKYIFQIKYTEAILSNSTQKLLRFEISSNYQNADCRFAV